MEKNEIQTSVMRIQFCVTADGVKQAINANTQAHTQAHTYTHAHTN